MVIASNLEKTAISAPRARSGTCLHFSIGASLADLDRETIVATRDHFDGNEHRCAQVLGVSAKTLYNRHSEYNHCSDVVPLCVV